MSFLFWLLWIIDVLLAFLVAGGSQFRSGFGASTDLNSWLLIGLVIILTGSLILRFVLRQREISIIVAALPFIGMLVMYFVEKITKTGNG